MYKIFYRFGQNIISNIFQTQNNIWFNIAKLISASRYQEIYDIGGSDGIILKYLNPIKYKYYCYDLDTHNLNIGRKKYKNYKNVFFKKKSIENLNIKNNKKKLYLLIGVLHHLDDTKIKKFLKTIKKNDDVIAIDPFFHKNQNYIALLLKKLDRGKYIRSLKNYKKILKNFNFIKKINYYLKFYSHLISYRGTKREKIIKYL